MSDIADLPEAQASEDLPPFLDGDAKDDLIANQHGFLITNARPHVPSTNPAYKAQTMFEIALLTDGAVQYLEQNGKGEGGKVKAADGTLVAATAPGWAPNAKRWMLALGHNDKRQKQAEQVLEQLALGKPMVGPAWFSEIPPTIPGHSPTRIIVGTPKPVATKAKKTNGTQAPTPVADEDIPF